MEDTYEEFCDKFEIVVSEEAEDRGDPIEALARLLISMAENSL